MQLFSKKQVQHRLRLGCFIIWPYDLLQHGWLGCMQSLVKKHMDILFISYVAGRAHLTLQKGYRHKATLEYGSC